jgi:hypothetical protein
MRERTLLRKSNVEAPQNITIAEMQMPEHTATQKNRQSPGVVRFSSIPVMWFCVTRL